MEACGGIGCSSPIRICKGSTEGEKEGQIQAVLVCVLPAGEYIPAADGCLFVSLGVCGVGKIDSPVLRISGYIYVSCIQSPNIIRGGLIIEIQCLDLDMYLPA